MSDDDIKWITSLRSDIVDFCVKNGNVIDIDVLNQFLDDYVSQHGNIYDEWGYSRSTAFHYCIRKNKYDIAKLFIDAFEHNIYMNIKDDKGMNPLHWVCENDNFELLKLLIDNFKDRIYINEVDNDYFTALYRALLNGNYGMVKLLLFTFKDEIYISNEICYYTLDYACDAADIELANFLFDHFQNNIDINVAYKVWSRPIFHKVCNNGDIYMFELLLDKFKNQIDINLQAAPYYVLGSKTVLQLALCEGYVDIVELLIDNFKDKIKINVQDKEGRTAMFYSLGIEDLAQLLIDNFKDEIDIMILDNENKAAWYNFLIFHGEERFKDLFLPLLLNRDKSKDPDGLTPLHIAYLLRNQKEFTIFDAGSVEYNAEAILETLLNIPELVELDGLQRDKFQTLPHQVTPLPIKNK